MTDRTRWIRQALDDLEGLGLRRTLRHRADATGTSFQGRLNLSSNDYLDLAGDPRLAAAAADAAQRWGAGSGASRLVTGSTTLHERLERSIADWKGTEDAVVFSSGYLANVGVIPALAGRGDAVFSDALNHASIIDGCRLAGASLHVWPHKDTVTLARLLDSTPARRRLIVTDGIFSMDGDAADLTVLADLADRSDAMLMVDDAHGCGVVGPDGRGSAVAQGCEDRVDVIVGTLSKAFGAAGGYVAARADVCAWVRNRARTFVFDTAMPPPTAGAALTGLSLSVAEPWRRETATALARRLATGIGAPQPAGCIVPLVVGDAHDAVALSDRLRREGVEATAIRPPSVPDGTSRLRFATSAGLKPEDIDAVVALVADARAAGS